MGSQASQNKVILSVPRGVRFMIVLNTSTFGNNHNLSKMTLAHRTTRHARAVPLIEAINFSMRVPLYQPELLNRF